MSYQIDFLNALKALFVPMDWGLFFSLGAVPIVMCSVLYLTRKNRGISNGVCWAMLILSFLIPLVLIPLSIQGGIGSGWQLEQKHLKINAWLEHETLPLASIQIALQETAGPWQPIRRTYGYGTPGLSSGWFLLRNGTKAIVFRHLAPTQMVAIWSGERCYILAHLGVEELYRELVARGVPVRQL